MASRRIRNRRDNRAEADEFLALDEPEPDEFATTNSERIDLLAPWVIPQPAAQQQPSE